MRLGRAITPRVLMAMAGTGLGIVLVVALSRSTPVGPTTIPSATASSTATPTSTPTVNATPTVTATAVSASTAAPTATPPTPGSGGSLAISSTTVANGKAYLWDVLSSAKLQYIDRSHTFSQVPSQYSGLNYLRTANDDKASSDASFISFDVNEAVTVHVAYDSRITTVPAWLSSFTATSDTLVSGGGTFRIFYKDFPAGTVTLGGNEGAGYSMYTVIVRPKGTTTTPTATGMATPTAGLPAAPTPGPSAMTIYAVTNPNPFSISVRHIITDSTSFRYEFSSVVPAQSTAEYHLRDMASVPSPFVGAMTLLSDQQFTARIVDYDYPKLTAPVSAPDAAQGR